MTPQNFALKNFVTSVTGDVYECGGGGGGNAGTTTIPDTGFTMDLVDQQDTVFLVALRNCAHSSERIKIVSYRWDNYEQELAEVTWTASSSDINFYDSPGGSGQISATTKKHTVYVGVETNEEVESTITGVPDYTHQGNSNKVGVAFGSKLGQVKLEGFSIITKTFTDEYELKDPQATILGFIEEFVEGKVTQGNPYVGFLREITSKVDKYTQAAKIAVEFFSTLGLKVTDVEVALELSGGVCDCSGNNPTIETVEFGSSYSASQYYYPNNFLFIPIFPLTEEVLDTLFDLYVAVSIKAFEDGRSEWIIVQEEYK